MVQALLQGGEYRKALAFAILTAHEHADSRGAQALQAWLEFLGGQRQVALQGLEVALRATPHHPALRDVEARIRAVDRGAPYSPASPKSLALDPHARRWSGAPSALRGRASGVLVDGGTRVLTSAPDLASAGGGLWVRNALGQLRPAVVERSERLTGVAVLKLAEPLEHAAGSGTGDMARAFPGSPCYVVEYPAPGMDRPSWPVLSVGFLGRAGQDAGMAELSIDLPPGPRGGAVLDRGGRLVGLVLPTAGRPGTAGRSALPAHAALAPALQSLLSKGGGAPVQENGPSPRMPLGEVYEKALSSVVTVMSAR